MKGALRIPVKNSKSSSIIKNGTKRQTKNNQVRFSTSEQQILLEKRPEFNCTENTAFLIKASVNSPCPHDARLILIKLMEHWFFLIVIVFLIFSDIIFFGIILSWKNSIKTVNFALTMSCVLGSIFLLEMLLRIMLLWREFMTLWRLLGDFIIITAFIGVFLERFALDNRFPIHVGDNCKRCRIAIGMIRITRIGLQTLYYGRQIEIKYSLIQSTSLVTRRTRTFQETFNFKWKNVRLKNRSESKIIFDKRDEGDVELKRYLERTFTVSGISDMLSVQSDDVLRAETFTQVKCQPPHALFTLDEEDDRNNMSNKKNFDARVSIALEIIQSAAIMPRLFREWELDIFDISNRTQGNSLLCAGTILFRMYNLLRKFDIDAHKLHNFLYHIQEGYCKENPYHNSEHGADVLHSTQWLLLSGGGVSKKFGLVDEDILSALVAAAIHDYQHPGINNNFAIAAELGIAITYNDDSVLENHHVSAAFQVLKHDNCDIFHNIPPSQYRVIRSKIISIVLRTDMAHHFDHVNQIKETLTPEGILPNENIQQRKFLLDMIVHFADISNPSKPVEYFKKWSWLIMEEFFTQGDLEKILRIPRSPFFDRDAPNVSKCQSGYINYIVKPFFELFIKQSIPPLEAKKLEAYIEQNLTYWRKQPEGAWSCDPTPKIRGHRNITQYLQQLTSGVNNSVISHRGARSLSSKKFLRPMEKPTNSSLGSSLKAIATE